MTMPSPSRRTLPASDRIHAGGILGRAGFPRKRVALALLLATAAAILPPLATAGAACVRQGPANAGFESGEVGGAVEGWFLPTPSRDAGFRAEVTDKEPRGGKRCAMLWFDGLGEPAVFGNLMQTIEAAGWRGQRILLKASVRVEGSGRAQLWLRVDGPDGKSDLVDNMGDRPITSSKWAEYEIRGNVGADAQSIALGLIVFGRGRAYVDEVSISATGKAGEGIEKPRPLEGRALGNLVAFARLYGYVRHFHPSDAVEHADWERFAIAGVRAVEKAASARELADALGDLFRPVAPTVQVFPAGLAPEKPPALARPAAGELSVVRWRNEGFGTGMKGSIYKSFRQKKKLEGGELPTGWRAPEDTFVAEIGAGLACSVPLVLFADENGPLPRAPGKDEFGPLPRAPGNDEAGALPADFVPTGDDRSTRLADVVIAWNVFQHFYPYFDVVETDWPKELEKALASAATDADARAFLDTLRRLVAALHDGHGNVSHKSDASFGGPPLSSAWAEGKLVISNLPTDAPTGLELGQVFLSIDGEPVEEAYERAAALVSGATPQWIRFRATGDLLRGSVGSRMVLEIASIDGSKKKVEVERQFAPPKFRLQRPDKIAELEPGIWYVDIDRISDADFEGAVAKLADAKGIVFDLRGYPRLSTVVLAHLTDTPVSSAQWHIPRVPLPDRRETTFLQSGWEVQPKAPRFEAKTAFVTEGRAISYAETYLGIVEHYKLSEIVGEPTAGTNGNVNPFSLPGGYSVVWTGMKVLKHDGSQHHGIGIRPTVPVSRTIAGIAAGRDEMLERAVEVVKR